MQIFHGHIFVSYLHILNCNMILWVLCNITRVQNQRGIIYIVYALLILTRQWSSNELGVKFDAQCFRHGRTKYERHIQYSSEWLKFISLGHVTYESFTKKWRMQFNGSGWNMTCIPFLEKRMYSLKIGFKGSLTNYSLFAWLNLLPSVYTRLIFQRLLEEFVIFIRDHDFSQPDNKSLPGWIVDSIFAAIWRR